MIIIVGLGNPGEKFKNTRHNIGFMAVDFFAKENDFPDFELSKKCQSLISQKDNVILAKPQTFMNKSGLAVNKIAKSYNLKTKNLIVVHDDIDLPLGKLKIVKNRGSAGHKGAESVIKNVGNKNLIRLRIGVRPAEGKPKNPENFVVKNFTKEEQRIANRAIKNATEAFGCFVENGLEKTMNVYNK